MTFNPVTPLDFGAVGDGITDDTVAVQAALSKTFGNTVYLPGGYTFKCGNLSVPRGAGIHGPLGVAGAPGMGNFSPDYNTLSSIRLTLGSTITLNGGNCLDGILIAPSSMVFPQNKPGQPASWLGVALTVAGDDVTVRGCMVMGFRQAISSNAMSRLRISDCNLDCQGGIVINTSPDICYINNVHCWPFASISQAGTGDLVRWGVAYDFQQCISDMKVIGCFSFGYYIGYRLSGSIMTMIGCSADNLNNGFGVGVWIDGNTSNAFLVNCLASGMVNAFYIGSTAAGGQITLSECRAMGFQNSGVAIDAPTTANVSIRGGYYTSGNYGVSVQTPNPVIRIDGVDFTAVNQDVFLTVPGSNVHLDDCTYGNSAPGLPAIGPNLTIPTISSSGTINLDANETAYTVTGTATITSICGGWAGRELTMIFNDAATVNSGMASVNSMRLSGGTPFKAKSGSTLTLKHTGAQWFETGRCI